MPQPWCENFTVQGRRINLNLRIELVGDAKGSGEELAGISEPNVDDDDSSARNNGAPLPLVINHNKGEVDSTMKLKERLRLAEMNCSRLERLYQKYRLRWLEENYRARVLEEYAPHGISTCSPHQITWDAPSPTQSEYDPEFEDQE